MIYIYLLSFLLLNNISGEKEAIIPFYGENKSGKIQKSNPEINNKIANINRIKIKTVIIHKIQKKMSKTIILSFLGYAGNINNNKISTTIKMK